mmetsp:Transcript_72676/g.142561  ORF Transcript_72676/g.142561 Transcript_72676/m.142561 type:complete len:83 (-) Transcript_72676:112-360(-)
MVQLPAPARLVDKPLATCGLMGVDEYAGELCLRLQHQHSDPHLVSLMQHDRILGARLHLLRLSLFIHAGGLRSHHHGRDFPC